MRVIPVTNWNRFLKIHFMHSRLVDSFRSLHLQSLQWLIASLDLCHLQLQFFGQQGGGRGSILHSAEDGTETPAWLHPEGAQKSLRGAILSLCRGDHAWHRQGSGWWDQHLPLQHPSPGVTVQGQGVQGPLQSGSSTLGWLWPFWGQN